MTLILDQDPITLTNATSVDSSVGESVRQGVFNTVAIQTTTGFCTSDFNRFPFLAQGTLILLMFIGGVRGLHGRRNQGDPDLGGVPGDGVGA